MQLIHFRHKGLKVLYADDSAKGVRPLWPTSCASFSSCSKRLTISTK